MATPAQRTNEHALFIGFNYDVAPSEGDVLEITAGRKVQKLSSTGGLNRVGVCEGLRSTLKECTVATPFRQNRIDRIAGEIVTIGLFVFGADNKVYQYNPTSHDANAVAGLIIVGADAGAACETLEY